MTSAISGVSYLGSFLVLNVIFFLRLLSAERRNMSNRNRLTLSDRIIIEAGIAAKKSFYSIAKELRRSTSTVIREVQNNCIVITSLKPFGKDCMYASECRQTGLCGLDCKRSCKFCEKQDCQDYCSRRNDLNCINHSRPPYVCNGCKYKLKKSCKCHKKFYVAEKADAKAKKTRSEARKGIRMSDKELRRIDEIISPLLRQGQPLTHNMANHGEEIGRSERSIYNYIEAGKLRVTNLDLRRKVKYRRRRKKSEIPCNKFNYRIGRTYEDWQEYMKNHPDTKYVEMDTVRGKREKGKVLLTMIFVEESLMIAFLMEDGTQESVNKIFDMLTKKLGIRRFRRLFPVILTDNGGEFKDALKLEYTPNGADRTKVFYCDPQASWQKPHVEKNHEYIRYVIPKGTSLDSYSQEDVTLMMNHINSTSRPGFNNKSPYGLELSDDMKKLLEILDMSSVAADDICLKPALLKK